jgi:hypothetical protein
MIMLILLGIFLVLLLSKGAGLLIEYHFQHECMEIERKAREEQNRILAEYTKQVLELTTSVLKGEQ